MKCRELMTALEKLPEDAEIYLKVQREWFNGSACWYVEDLEDVSLCDYGTYKAIGLYGKDQTNA